MSDLSQEYEIHSLKLGSPLRTRLAAGGQKVASPEQWTGLIRNLQKNGVAQAELDWSGVEDFLKHSTDKRIPLQDLLDFLNDRPPCELTLVRHISSVFDPIVRFEKLIAPKEIPAYEVKNRKREVRLLHYRERSFGIQVWLHLGYDMGLFGREKYWTVNVQGGRKHFRGFEPLKKFRDPAAALAYGRKLIKDLALRLTERQFTGGVRSKNIYPYYVLPEGENYTEWLIVANNLRDAYWSPHFDVRNLIAHVRTTDRISRDHGKILVMEEIQSDWNQALREWEKFVAPLRSEETAEECPPDNPYRYHWLEAALRIMLLLAATRGLNGISWLPGSMHAERFSWANAEGLEGFYDDLVPKAVTKLAKSWDAELGEISISTLSRDFGIERINGTTLYRIFEKSTKQRLDQKFENLTEAHAYKNLLEKPIEETLPALIIIEVMHSDLIEKGLPSLGAVGSRIAGNTNPSKRRDPK